MEDGFPKLPGNIYTQNIVGMALVGLMMVGLSTRSVIPMSTASAMAPSSLSSTKT